MFRRKYQNQCALITGFAAILICGCAPPSAPPAAGTSTNDISGLGLSQLQPTAPIRAVTGEYLVKFKTGTSNAAAAHTLKMAALDPVREFRSVPGLRLVRAGKGDPGNAMLKAALSADAHIEYVEPNFIYHALAVPNDPQYPRLQAIRYIGAEAAWDITTGSDDVVVAVIDTGVDYRHEDLAANIWSNPGDCDGDGVDDDGSGYVDDCHGIDTVDGDADPMDDVPHGTHVAGIIGAVGNNGVGIAGVAWHVKILPCRFLNAAGEGTAANAIQCLDYLALMKQRGVNLIASNNSWGYPQTSRALEDAIRAQLDLGMLFVAAAGNNRLEDVDVIPHYPCASEVANVICVASASELVDDFSNLGRGTVLLGAPGNDIFSTLPGNRYDSFSGTSMAASHVTGALVLLKAQDPARSLWALRNLVAAGAVVPSVGAIPTVTGGRLDLFNSLNCTNRTVLARLRPMNFATLLRSPGDSVTIRALHVRCSAPDGDVSVTVSPTGETVSLRDDGVGADEFAGDGVYSADWIAHGAGEYTFAFPAPETETFTVKVDPDLKPGFPLRTNNQGAFDFGGGEEALAVGNITGDAQLEVASLSQPGFLTVWNSRGRMLPGWPRYGSRASIGVTLGNFDEDVSTLEPIAQYFLDMRLYRGDGTSIASWLQAEGTSVLPFAAADLDGDGIDEILSNPARRADGSVFRTDIDVPAQIDPAHGVSYAVRAGDLDADGRVDLVGISVSDGAPQFWISDAEGLRPGFPVPLPSDTNEFSALRTFIGDVDGDGMPNIVVGSMDNRNLRSQVQVFDNRGRLLRTLYMSSTAREELALADVDGDGIPEIVRVAFSEIGVQRGDGTILPGWPRQIPGIFLAREPAIGDVDGDGEVDIVATGFQYEGISSGRDSLHIFHADGSYLPGFPRTIAADFPDASTPVIADIDLDGRNDVLVVFGRGFGLRETVFAYDLHGAGSYGRIEWSQLSGDARHTGYYETGKNLPGHAFLATQVYGSGGITSSDGGIDCRRDCIERYAKGSQVVLTATPLAGGTFRRWRGACANHGNPCILPMLRFAQTSADFDARLSMTVTGNGLVTSDVAGIRCPDDCDESFDGRSLVTLTAVETATSGLSSWSGACSGAEDTCRVFIDEAKSVGANFVSEFPLTVNKSGTGTAVVTSSAGNINCGTSCSANFPIRSHVTITVAPAPDTYLVSWHRPDCDDHVLSCDLTVDRPLSLDLELALKPVISVTISGRGRLEVQPGDLTCSTNCRFPLDMGSVVTLNAVPDAGWQFVRFEGMCAGVPVPGCTRVLTGDVAVTVVFAGGNYTLTVTRAGTGSGTIASTSGEVSCAANCAVSIPPGRVLTLVATPDVGSSFGGWGGACSGVGDCVVTMNDAVALTGTFTRATGGTGGGSGSGSSRGGGGGSLDWWLLSALALLCARRRHLYPKGLSRESGGFENHTGSFSPM